jgi:hypothetical protein
MTYKEYFLSYIYVPNLIWSFLSNLLVLQLGP